MCTTTHLSDHVQDTRLQDYTSNKRGWRFCLDATLGIKAHRWVSGEHPRYTDARKGRPWAAQQHHNSTTRLRHLHDTAARLSNTYRQCDHARVLHLKDINVRQPPPAPRIEHRPSTVSARNAHRRFVKAFRISVSPSLLSSGEVLPEGNRDDAGDSAGEAWEQNVETAIRPEPQPLEQHTDRGREAACKTEPEKPESTFR